MKHYTDINVSDGKTDDPFSLPPGKRTIRKTLQYGEQFSLPEMYFDFNDDDRPDWLL